MPTPQENRKALHCLEAKVIGRPLPSSLDEGIRLEDLFNLRPEELPGVPDKGGKRLYFTTPIWVNGLRKRSSKFGRWDGRDGKQIRDSEGRPLGFVRRLTYRQGPFPGERTNWAMEEYTLDESRIPTGEKEWVLCIIHKTKDYKRKGTTSGDVGPSNIPSSEPVMQAEHQLSELTDLSLSNSFATAEFPPYPIMNLMNYPRYTTEPSMDLVHECGQWYEEYYIWS